MGRTKEQQKQLDEERKTEYRDLQNHRLQKLQENMMARNIAVETKSEDTANGIKTYTVDYTKEHNHSIDDLLGDNIAILLEEDTIKAEEKGLKVVWKFMLHMFGEDFHVWARRATLGTDQIMVDVTKPNDTTPDHEKNGPSYNKIIHRITSGNTNKKDLAQFIIETGFDKPSTEERDWSTCLSNEQKLGCAELLACGLLAECAMPNRQATCFSRKTGRSPCASLHTKHILHDIADGEYSFEDAFLGDLPDRKCVYSGTGGTDAMRRLVLEPDVADLFGDLLLE